MDGNVLIVSAWPSVTVSAFTAGNTKECGKRQKTNNAILVISQFTRSLFLNAPAALETRAGRLDFAWFCRHDLARVERFQSVAVTLMRRRNPSEYCRKTISFFATLHPPRRSRQEQKKKCITYRRAIDRVAAFSRT